MRKKILGLCLAACLSMSLASAAVTFEPLANLTPTVPIQPGQIFKDDYGHVIHCHPDGKYLFVGAPVSRPDPTKTAEGAVFVYVKQNDNWTLTQVVSRNGTADHFSTFRIRAFDDWLFVSAMGTPVGPISDDIIANQDFTGSIQIYKRNNAGQYVFFQTLDRATPGIENLSVVNPLFFEPVPPPLWSIELGGLFGITFDFSENHDYLLVGACTQEGVDDNSQPLLNAGVVYSFKRNPQTGVWELAQTLHDPYGQVANGTFGGVIKTFKDYALISTSAIAVDAKINGSSYVYLYKLNQGNWEFLQKLESDQIVGLDVNSPPYGGNVEMSDNFGASLAFEDNWALIGAPFAHLDSDSIKGAAYLYKLVGSQLQFKQKIVSDDPNALMTGVAVALDGKVALVGDPVHTGPLGQTAQGAILVYHRNGNTWEKEANLFDPNGGAYQMFSNGLDVRKDIIFGGTGTAIAAITLDFLFVPPFINIPLPVEDNNVVIWRRHGN